MYIVAGLEDNNLTKFHWGITNAHGDGLDHVLLDGLRGQGHHAKILMQNTLIF